MGLVVGVPAAVGSAALLATVRSIFDSTNVAMVLMIVVVAVAALGGRAAGMVTAIAAMVSFDFFHTRPYLSFTISSRDDVETTVLLLIAAVFVGTLATWGRSARGRAGASSAEIRRIHRVAEAAVAGGDVATMIAVAEAELCGVLSLRESRFEAQPASGHHVLPRLSRQGSIEDVTHLRYGVGDGGRGGFELSAEGVELPVLARGQHIGRFILVPTPGVAVSLEQRMVAVAIADQVAAVWIPTQTLHQEQCR